ncbi:MAG: extracellular solute-binding protein [Deltaproteobacteria bacterium]|nr:extracellular solute-binding protein [Deltaproteobacteria bacterium]
MTLWHAYRGAEQQALEQLIRSFERTQPNVRVSVLAVPFDAYASKLEAAIPRQNGPDLFLDAHERVSSYRARGLIVDSDAVLDLARTEASGAGARLSASDVFEQVSLDAFSANSHVWGAPLALKCLALFVDEALYVRAGSPPLDELESLSAFTDGRLGEGVVPLVYYASNAYFHAPILHAFGGSLLDPADGRYAFVGERAERSVQFVTQLQRDHVTPQELDGAAVSQMFRAGKSLAAISGPWMLGELGDRPVRIVALPRLRQTGQPMRSFVTVEGALLAQHAREPALARALAAFLVRADAAQVRARVGRQVVATRAAWSDPALAQDRTLQPFLRAARVGLAMPTHSNMRLAFEPANQALRRALRDPAALRVALEAGARRFAVGTRPLPPASNPLWLQLLLGSLALTAIYRTVQRARDPVFRQSVRASRTAYAYVSHAVIVVGLLVVSPLVVGALTSLYAGRDGALSYVGTANYREILTAQGAGLLSSGSFYAVLLVTVLWTLANLVLHVSIGVILALLLSRTWLSLRGIYRVLLIVPWAVPSYVTALSWKGMFQRQTGAINAMLHMVGVEPVSWFASFSTAFTANVLTNTWLGFPFMMVVTLGALAGIPQDLYEAAEVDGASAWQQFWLITVPLLKPSLLPAVAMGAVWTFNQFNVIYLVSGGEPDGGTEILVTEAYRWAFTRQAQYGYAAAYAVLIFGVLVLLTRALDRVTQGPARPKGENS